MGGCTAFVQNRKEKDEKEKKNQSQIKKKKKKKRDRHSRAQRRLRRMALGQNDLALLASTSRQPPLLSSGEAQRRQKPLSGALGSSATAQHTLEGINQPRPSLTTFHEANSFQHPRRPFPTPAAQRPRSPRRISLQSPRPPKEPPVPGRVAVQGPPALVLACLRASVRSGDCRLACRGGRPSWLILSTGNRT